MGISVSENLGNGKGVLRMILDDILVNKLKHERRAVHEKVSFDFEGSVGGVELQEV